MVEVVSEDNFALKGVSFVNDYLIADYIDHADMRSAIVFFNHSGEQLDVTLPESLSGTIGSRVLVMTQ